MVPLLIFTISKNTYYYYDERGDQNQQEQEPQGYYDQYGNWIQYQQKHWWQFWKNDNYRGQEEQRSQDDQFQVPWWCKCDTYVQYLVATIQAYFIVKGYI